MVQAGVIEHRKHRMHSARFRIVRAVDQPANASMNQSPCAHGARFNCSKQLAVGQTVVTKIATGLAESQDLGMRGGIVVGNVAIPTAADDTSVAHDDCADRHFSHFERALRRPQGFFHPEFVRGSGQWSVANG